MDQQLLQQLEERRLGLLAPLYAVAALAIAGPIIFHLIRRQPQGQQQFSSLMFLQPSPPRLTQRSRIDNWLLLLLRALAIGLIAFAFARPYLREESLLNVNLDGRNIVAVLDTSASMQREDVWKGALAELDEILDSLSPEDRIALYTVDEEVTPVVALEKEGAVAAATTQEAVRQALKDVEASWKKSDIALGLTTVADALNAEIISDGQAAGKSSEIVLVSDLHQECGLDALQGFPWPESVKLDVRRIIPSVPGNARPSLMVAEDAAASGEEQVRIRVENNSDSKEPTVELAWANEDGPISGAPTRVQVPPGQVRVVPMSGQPSGADRVRLLGDVWGDDNDVFVAKTDPAMQRIAYVGQPNLQKEDDPGYFLKVAPLSTPLATRDVQSINAKDLGKVLGDKEFRSVVLEPVPGIERQGTALREFASQGGTVLVILARETSPSLSAPLLNDLLDVSDTKISEVTPTKEYSLLGWLNYKSPVFSPFADPRFNDFSKLRFWSHRGLKIGTPNNQDSVQVNTVAKFDDDSPLLIQQPVGKGYIWVLTAGWQPNASGLALSTKFLPILMGMLDPSGTFRKLQPTFEVGEQIVSKTEDLAVYDQANRELGEDVLSISESSYTISKPGLYDVRSDGLTQQVAIQIPASESRLVPLDEDVFEQYGIALGTVSSDSQRKEAARQMQVEELERKQRLWQWLIAAGIIVLALETILAGWSARRQTRQLAAT